MKDYFKSYKVKKNVISVNINKLTKIFIILNLVFVIIGFGSNLLGWISDDAKWNTGAALRLPTLDPYAPDTRLVDVAPPLGSPIGYPPLLLLLTYPLLYLEKEFDLDVYQGTVFYKIWLYLADAASVWLIVLMLMKYYPRIKTQQLAVIIFWLLFSGPMFYATFYIGHAEPLVLFFTLASIYTITSIVNNRTGVFNIIKSALFLGLSLASKLSAVFIIIPVIYYLLLHNLKLKQIIIFLLTIFLVFMALLGPFLINNYENVYYGVFGFVDKLIIQGPNLWWLIFSLMKNFTNANFLHGTLINIANPILMIVMLFSVLFAFTRKTPDKILKLLTALCLSVFTYSIWGKWTSYHFFLLNMVFLLLWEIRRFKTGAPIYWQIYTLSVTVFTFIGTPMWQLIILLINGFYFVFIFWDTWKFNLILVKKTKFKQK